jgi:hypothetical protein
VRNRLNARPITCRRCFAGANCSTYNRELSAAGSPRYPTNSRPSRPTDSLRTRLNLPVPSSALHHAVLPTNESLRQQGFVTLGAAEQSDQCDKLTEVRRRSPAGSRSAFPGSRKSTKNDRIRQPGAGRQFLRRHPATAATEISRQIPPSVLARSDSGNLAAHGHFGLDPTVCGKAKAWRKWKSCPTWGGMLARVWGRRLRSRQRVIRRNSRLFFPTPILQAVIATAFLTTRARPFLARRMHGSRGSALQDATDAAYSASPRETNSGRSSGPCEGRPHYGCLGFQRTQRQY